MDWLRIGLALLGRPELWPTAFRQVRRLAEPGWWHRPPFLPVPRGRYLRFRMATQYGDAGHRPEATDVINYLAWCRRWDRLR